MNPIYNMLRGQQTNTMQSILNRFNQFRSAFNGNAQQQVQEMLQSGRISQQQYNDAVQKANEIMRMINPR